MSPQGADELQAILPEDDNPYGAPPTFSKRFLLPMRVRFDLYVEKTDTCWIWTGFVGGNGYGRFSIGDGRSFHAHRVSYELVHGLVPEGLEVDHLCRNPRCVRPEHLEAVNHSENCLRRPRRTHCMRGHAFEEFGSIEKGGARRCRECRRIRTNAQRILKTGIRGEGKWQSVRTHCQHGHLYDEANTYLYKGARHCRTCSAMRIKEFKRKTRTKAKAEL